MNLSTNFVKNIISSISALLHRGRPTAVFRAVTAVVLLPVDRQIIAVAVGKRPVSERFKAFPPRVAHCDPASSVVRIIVIFIEITAVFHANPDAVKTGVSRPVLRVALPHLSTHFAPQAAARLHATCLEVIAARHDLAAAGAAAEP